jgi:hypothetical protein
MVTLTTTSQQLPGVQVHFCCALRLASHSLQPAPGKCKGSGLSLGSNLFTCASNAQCTLLITFLEKKTLIGTSMRSIFHRGNPELQSPSSRYPCCLNPCPTVPPSLQPVQVPADGRSCSTPPSLHSHCPSLIESEERDELDETGTLDAGCVRERKSHHSVASNCHLATFPFTPLPTSRMRPRSLIPHPTHPNQGLASSTLHQRERDSQIG